MPTLDEQVTFITGVTSGGVVAAQTSKTWDNNTNPATYGPGSNAGKWGASNAAGTGGGNINYDFVDASGWNAAEQNVFNSIFALYAAIANITFTEVASLAVADPGIRIERGGLGSGAFANAALVTSDPAAGTVGGTKLWTIPRSTINIETGEPSFALDETGFATFTRAGGHPWTTALHEIGHALGLGHAGPYPVNATASESLQYSVYDSEVHTVMSYIHPSDATPNSGSYPVTGTNWGTVNNGPAIWKRNPVTLMPLDILALQRLYGTPTTTPLSGGQTYGFNTNIGGLLQKFFDFTINTAPVVTLWNGGSNNTLDLSGYSSASTVNLMPGSYSSAAGLVNNIAIAYGTRIDLLRTGIGDDTVTGNSNGNYLSTGLGTDTINASSGIDTLVGGLGNDTLSGGSNVDTAEFAGPRAAYTITQTSTGNFTISGIDGTDTLTGIEYAKFDDQIYRLLPGDGVVVNFAAAPATYMGPIRDFDGNNLTGQGTRVIEAGSGALVNGGAWDGVSGWSLAGTTDVNRSGLQARILFNNQIGRWAEATTQADGKVYFSNHGWAGDTRIVGIYVDPLVQSGQVQAGGDHDSQRRFQNDLFIGNLKSVLDAADYDRDGFQEIYFSLTDGTAYLHAYMHADGNIRYANYQSKQQVQDYIAANSYAGSLSWLSAAPPEPVTSNFAPALPMEDSWISSAGTSLAAPDRLYQELRGTGTAALFAAGSV